MKLQVSEAKAVKMLGEVDELFDDAETRWRTKHGPRTVENVAFYRGIQYFAKKMPQPNELKDPRGELTEVLNFSQTLINEAVADMLSQEPELKIASAKDDPRARGRADMTEKLGRSFMRNGVIDFDEYFNATLWAFITGGGWIKTGWDPFAGRHLRNTDSGFDYDDEKEDEDEGPLISPYQGEIFTEYVSSVDGLPCATAKNAKPRELTHFFHRKLKPIRELVNMWPRDAFGKPTLRRWDDGTHSPEQSFVRAVSDEITATVGSAQESVGADLNRLAQVVEFWELPCRKYPNGRLVIYSGHMILYAGENPYTPARIPFTLFRGPNRIPDGLYPDGMMESLKPVQRTANKLASKVMEIANKMANPHLLVPIGSGIDKNTWGNIPGQTIPYFKGFKPDILQAAEVPAWIFNYLNDQIERAKFLTGVSDQSRGEVNSGVSGRTFAFANQQQQKLRAPSRAAQKAALNQVIQQCVWLAREKYDDGRMMQMLGNSIEQMDLIEFRGDDYDWDNDFLPEPYSDEPQTLQDRVSTAIELTGAGIFDDTPQAERARRFIGQHLSRKSAFDPFDKDRQNAQRENQRVISDAFYQMQVHNFDIDRIHLEEHNDFRKSPQYNALEPWRKAMLDQHCEIHALKMKLNDIGVDMENMLGPKPPPPGMNMGAPNPQQLGEGPGVESPPDGGAGMPGAAPPVDQFAEMSESEQRATDQR